MNPKDLIETAAAFCRLAENETNRDRGSLERAAHYATIAQAHSATAQAMIDLWRYQDERADAERSELHAIWSAS